MQPKANLDLVRSMAVLLVLVEHILLALMHEADLAIKLALQHANVSPEQVSTRVEEMLRAREIGA